MSKLEEVLSKIRDKKPEKFVEGLVLVEKKTEEGNYKVVLKSKGYFVEAKTGDDSIVKRIQPDKPFELPDFPGLKEALSTVEPSQVYHNLNKLLDSEVESYEDAMKKKYTRREKCGWGAVSLAGFGLAGTMGFALSYMLDPITPIGVICGSILLLCGVCGAGIGTYSLTNIPQVSKRNKKINTGRQKQIDDIKAYQKGLGARK